MAILKAKRGSGVPSGLTAWEIAYDFTNGKFYIGNTAGSPILLGSSGGGSGVTKYVESLVGLTGNIGIAAGSGITTSISGQTLTIAHNIGNTNANATYYPAFYGTTSGIAIPQTDSSLQYNASTHVLSSIGGFVLKGVSSAGSSENSINLRNPSVGGMQFTSSDGNFSFDHVDSSFGKDGSITLVGHDGVDTPFNSKIIPQSPSSASTNYMLPAISIPGATFAILETIQTFSGFKNFSSGIGVTGGTFSGTQTFVNGATFSARTNFVAGLCASGGITFSGQLTGVSATFSGLIISSAGFSGTGITLSGNLSAATKSFVIPHPLKKNMSLRYGSLEGPENGVYVRGKLEGTDTINLPDYWSKLIDKDSITVNLTPIKSPDIHFIKTITKSKVTVGSASGNINCFYTVYAERKDVPKLTVEY